MLANAFIGKTKRPSEDELATVLGPSKGLWDQIVAGLRDEHGLDTQEWTSYSPKAGWSMRLKRQKRNIVYFSPCHGCFQVMFILGDKAMKAARAGKLPSAILKILDGAPRYPEGTGVRLQVKRAKDLPVIMKLAAVKIAN